MADINELKGIFASKLGLVKNKTKGFANSAADKAKDVTRIAKLTMEINSEKDAMKKAYIEIGKLYYETHKDEPDGFFVQLCDEVTMALESIAAKEAEIAELKEDIKDFDGDDDIEVIEDLEAEEADAESVSDVIVELTEEVAEEVKEVVEEVKDIVEEVTENIVGDEKSAE